MFVKLGIEKSVSLLSSTVKKSRENSVGFKRRFFSVFAMFLMFGYFGQSAKAQPISDGPVTGNAMAMTSLANYPIGSNRDWRVSIRFKSDYSGSLALFKLFWKYNAAGYSAGDGGDIKITLRSDDETASHNPSTTILATTTFSPNIRSGVDVRFKNLSFDSAPSIEKGKTYHLHFENVDPNKSSNWISINNVFNSSKNMSILQPAEDTTEWALLNRLGATGKWQISAGFCPILALGISTSGGSTPDVYQGNGYMEFWGAATNGVRVGGSGQLRQAFKATESLSVGGVSISAGKYSGTGSLQVELLSSAGEVLGSGTISSGSFPNASSSAGCPGGASGEKCHVWSYAQFSNVPSIVAGQSYFLRLSAPSGSEYRFNFPRDGSIRYGWPAGTVVSGRAERSTTSGQTWSGITYWGVSNRSDADMEFFLEAL
jgi:hypothetical protein